MIYKLERIWLQLPSLLYFSFCSLFNTCLVCIIVHCFRKSFLFHYHQIKSNAVRALGNLSRFVKYTFLSGACDKPMDYTGLSPKTSGNEVFPSSSYMKGSHTSNSLHPASMGDPCQLERMVQAFISCVTTGNVKVSYPHCYICGTTFVVGLGWEVAYLCF